MKFLPEFLQGQRRTDSMWGLVVGAILTIGVGFSYGGWWTGGGAKEMAAKQVNTALVTAYTPVCVQRFMSSATAEQRKKFDESSTYRRDSVLEEAGFATPPGSARPNGDIGDACAKGVETALADLAKAGVKKQ